MPRILIIYGKVGNAFWMMWRRFSLEFCSAQGSQKSGFAEIYAVADGKILIWWLLFPE
jgi:uncharacterized membrane-anchored protein